MMVRFWVDAGLILCRFWIDSGPILGRYTVIEPGWLNDSTNVCRLPSLSWAEEATRKPSRYRFLRATASEEKAMPPSEA